MALAILIIVITVMVLLARAGRNAKKREAFNKLPESSKDQIIAERQRRLKETDELITTILPIIRDK